MTARYTQRTCSWYNHRLVGNANDNDDSGGDDGDDSGDDGGDNNDSGDADGGDGGDSGSGDNDGDGDAITERRATVTACHQGNWE